MNRIMAFLETCGADAELASADTASLTAAARAAGLSDAEIAAVLRLDEAQPQALLGARASMVCMVFPVREPEPEPDQEDEGDEEEAPEEPAEIRKLA